MRTVLENFYELDRPITQEDIVNLIAMFEMLRDNFSFLNTEYYKDNDFTNASLTKQDSVDIFKEAISILERDFHSHWYGKAIEIAQGKRDQINSQADIQTIMDESTNVVDFNKYKKEGK